MKPKTSPRRTAKVTSSTTTVLPKTFVNPLISIAMSQDMQLLLDPTQFDGCSEHSQPAEVTVGLLVAQLPRHLIDAIHSQRVHPPAHQLAGHADRPYMLPAAARR